MHHVKAKDQEPKAEEEKINRNHIEVAINRKELIINRIKVDATEMKRVVTEEDIIEDVVVTRDQEESKIRTLGYTNSIIWNLFNMKRLKSHQTWKFQQFLIRKTD